MSFAVRKRSHRVGEYYQAEKANNRLSLVGKIESRARQVNTKGESVSSSFLMDRTGPYLMYWSTTKSSIRRFPASRNFYRR